MPPTVLPVNLTRYPIDALNSAAGIAMISEAKRQLERTGLATFPGFLVDVEAALEALDVSEAFAADDYHNAYQLPDDNETYSPRHVRNVRMRTRVASIPYDKITGPARTIYEHLPGLVRAVVGKEELYPLADPLGAATINVFEPGWDHAWHYDESEFTTTLSLSKAQSGGDFQYTMPLRRRHHLRGGGESDVDDDDDNILAENATGAVINSHSEYSVDPYHGDEGCPAVYNASFEPGTLQIFGGRYSLHRVSKILGSRRRMVAVYCFSEIPGFVNSPEIQKMFWGRTAR